MERKFVTVISVFLVVAVLSKADSRDVGDVLRDADWSKMETVTVSMGEFSYSPSRLQFRSGVPYKLTIRNTGQGNHYFVSRGFFEAIALRKVETRDGEIKASQLTAVEVFPGRTVDLYFVPVTKDEFNLTCTIEGHADRGMTGKIVIE